MAAVHLRTAPRRSAEDRRQQILEAATALFARQGFGGTTTRQVAEGAHVNEAIIFRHFPTKEDLYWAVLEHKCEEGQGKKIVTEHLARNAPPEELFAGIARAFFRARQQDSTLGRLLLFSALEHHKLSQRIFRKHIADLYEALAQYIREQIRVGKFRDVDPLLAARGFWGMVVYHVLIQELFGAKRYQAFDVDEASRTLADVWLKGMLPDTPVPGSAKTGPDAGQRNGRDGKVRARVPAAKPERTAK
jgi:AcrR family transcriptional regulator